jgi:hypothetical protein
MEAGREVEFTRVMFTPHNENRVVWGTRPSFLLMVVSRLSGRRLKSVNASVQQRSILSGTSPKPTRSSGLMQIAGRKHPSGSAKTLVWTAGRT